MYDRIASSILARISKHGVDDVTIHRNDNGEIVVSYSGAEDEIDCMAADDAWRFVLDGQGVSCDGGVSTYSDWRGTRVEAWARFDLTGAQMRRVRVSA